MRTTLRRVCGVALIVVGVIAMPVPVVPGFVLILAGVGMLGSDHPWVRAGREWLRGRGVLRAERD